MSFENVEDIYTLAPAQEGLLYHATVEAGSDVYHDQITARVDDLQVHAFEAAWQEVLQRHASLRTAFLWDGLDEPLQIVRENVELELQVLDWREESDVEARWRELLRRDRSRGFALDEAPLWRIALARAPDGWRLLWSFHHLVLDGWSARRVLDEVREIYRAALDGGQARLDPPFAYRDFIAHLAERDAPAAEAFWRDALAGFDRPIRLDALSDAGRAAGAPGARKVVRLPEAPSAALALFARGHGLTTATVLQGAWLLLLSRYSRERDVVTGLTISGRPAELDGALGGVGLFINTLPLRAEVAGQPLAGWLGALQRRQFAARRFEQTPLAHLQKWSELPAGEALFDHLLVIENHPQAGGAGPLELHDVDFLERSHYPFALLAVPGERLELQAVYDGTRYGEPFVDRLLRHLVTLLENIPAHAETPVDRLPMIDGAEEQRLLVDWNRTAQDFPRQARIVELVRQAGGADPQAIAAVCGGRQLSYGELLERSAALAATLRSLGAGPDVTVGLLIERSLDMLVGLLGILEAGAAYVPIDAAYPAEHISRVLEDSAARLLVSRRRHAAGLPAGELQVVWIDEPETWPAGEPAGGRRAGERRAGEQRVDRTADDLAYLIYTSGSSGVPKGVAVSHRNLVHSTTARFTAYDRQPGRFLLLSSFAFDSSVAGFFWTLAQGGTLILPRPGEQQDLDALDALLAEHRPTHTLCLPSLYRVLLEGARVDSLEVAVVAGEACAPELVEEHFRRLPATRLYNEYGPTEGTVWASLHEMTPADAGEKIVPIGRPIANTRLYLLDEHRLPVPAGVAGELYLAGEGVARGYWRRPELDEAAFVTLDLPHRQERAYRTGDLACHRHDGRLLFLGRADSQVKVRGFRIEIEGVEAALASLEGIDQAAAAARSTGRGARLLAWIVPSPGSRPDAANLRERLAESAPSYLVPDTIHIVDRLPRRPNGKVDYRALPDVLPADETAASSAPPRSETERTVAAAWADVLESVPDLAAIGARSNFFELGGDSILGIQVVSRLRQAGLAARPRDIAELPVLEDLARELEARSSADASTEHGPAVGGFALSPIQRWFFDRDLPRPAHWNMPALLEVDDRVTADDLQAALDELVRHHDLLRARFEPTGDGWRGSTAPPDDARITLETVSTESEQEAARAFAEAQAGLELCRPDARAPLVRAVLDGQRRRLLLAVHHLVVDTVSWIVLPEDLERALGQRLRGERIALPPRTASFAARTAELERQTADASAWPMPAPEAVPIPVDAVTAHSVAIKAPREKDAERHRQALDRDLTAALLALAPAYRADEVLVAALALALAPWRGSPRLYLALERHGRDGELDLSRTVGWFTASFPVELRLVEEENALRDVAAQLRAVGDPSSYGLLRYVRRDADLARLPEPRVLFNYLGQVPVSKGLLTPIAGAHRDARSGENPRSHLLEINAAVRDGRLELDWIYARTVHRAETVQGLAEAFERRLRQVVGESGQAESDTRALLEGRPELEDAYPLGELQESLLVHRLENVAADSGVLVLRADLHGRLDAERFEDAWRGTVERHPALRSLLIWRDLRAPVQGVARAADVPIDIDLRRITGGDAEKEIERAAAALHERGLDVERAPVMAWRLLVIDEGRHVLLWACHHLLLDGWSSALVLGEVLERYARRDPGPPPRAYREWVHWTRSVPFSGTDFWREARLEPRRLLLARPLAEKAAGAADFRSVHCRVESSGLDAWVRRHGVTAGSAAIACWGLVLSEATGTEHTSLGFTSSGRTADFDGLESMVGLFTCVLPMGFRVDPQARPPKLVRAVLERQAAMQSYPPRPLAQLFEGGGVTLLRPPFDSLLTFANFPVSLRPAEPGAAEDGLALTGLRGGVTSNFPLTIAVLPGPDGLRLDARFDRRRLGERRVEALLARFAALLETLDEEPATLEALLRQAPAKLPQKATSKPRDVPAKAARPLGGTGAEAPQGQTEAQLMRIWNDLVAVQEYGRHDNFFELGGHSLLVPQMLLRIERDFGVQLPLGVVFEDATVHAVARAIDSRRSQVDGDGAGWRPLVAIRPQEPGTETPLFMVHGLGGEVGWFYGLANFLDERVPLYGLQSPPEAHEQLEEMASRYLDEVRQVQPRGPYRFGGYCIGGGVAYEMARQAVAAGEQVETLVLIDSVPQAHIVDQQAPVPLAGRVKRLLGKEPREMVRSAGDFISRGAAGVVSQVAKKIRPAGDGARRERPMELDDVLDMSTLPQVYHEPSRRHFRAMRDYRPGPFAGDAWLLRTADERFGEDFGWGELVTGELMVERIPGRHVDVLKEPHVQVVGAKLSAALERPGQGPARSGR